MFHLNYIGNMKYVNRFKVIFALWVMLLGFCAFVSNNAYFNAFVIFFGFLFAILCAAYVLENMTEKESRFFNRLIKVL